MKEALKEARNAAEHGDVPVGAIIEKNGTLIASACNRVEADGDSTAHAEMLVIREAATKLGYKHLSGTTLYVTCEPCCMCAGAIVLARIAKLVIGTKDPKTGACGSVYNIVADERLNHRIEVESGVLEEECSRMLKDFFRGIRRNGRNNKISEQRKLKR